MSTGFQKMKKALYDYYCKVCKEQQEEAKSFDGFFDDVVAYKDRKDKYLVYVGYDRQDRVVYVGTTAQYPLSRWFYHKTHGKDLRFVEYARYDNENDMLDKEFELIQQLKPSKNKITKRRQNFNVALSSEELEKRKGDPQWCQCCLRRHVNKGYKYCFYCC